ncbi:unnamed protein product [Echinostoma caproni]|uniref:BACK domain-containing protein n=1 Tax=Echinostoma caproni TaxID=27848 RepID=A0A183B2B6_9TREM|nr:unnamed protein product [Echinostoma caproni]
MLDRSLFFDEEDLTRRCWHVIDVLASSVLSSNGLLHMDANNLKALLKRDTLNCKESEVFAAVRNWAAAECARLGLRDVIYNRAQIAAELLHLVRFPTMTLNDFAENVAYSGFLSLEMVRDLFVHITANNSAQSAKNARVGKTRSKPNNSPNAHTQLGGKPDVTGGGTVHGEPTPFIGPFPSEPRRGPQLWRCARFTRTGKHLITPNAGNTHQHSIVFQLGLLANLKKTSREMFGAETSVCTRQLCVYLYLEHVSPNCAHGINPLSQ